MIYDKSGKLIDSQYTKVILAYNQAKVVDVTSSSGSVTSDNTQDISDQDKVSLEDLKNLIKDAPQNDRVKLTQMLSNLQENWFDAREKTRNVIDFESYVDGMQMDDTKKQAFYNVLDSFMYTQTQTKDDVTLALNVIRGLLPKDNKNYKQISDDLDEIASHPTDTPDNKKLGTEILNFIKDDASVPQKDKLLIKSQLQSIINGGQTTGTGTTTGTVSTVQTANGGALGVAMGFLKILAYIILIVICGFFGLFIFFKATNKREEMGFQDFLIELFSGKKSTPPAAKKPAEDKKPEPKKDILAAVTKPEPEVKSAPPPAPTPTKLPEEEKIPDWMKPKRGGDDTTGGIPAPSTAETSPAPTTPTTDDANIPDWMKPAKTPEASETVAASVGSDTELPDWMRSIQTSEMSKADTVTVPTEDAEELPDWMKPVSTSEAPKVDTVAVPTEDENIPDWLRETPSVVVAPATAALEEAGPPDWMKPAKAPETSETVVAPTTDTELPDWMRSTQTPEAPKVNTVAVPTEDENIPDWLRETPSVVVAPAEAPATAALEETTFADWMQTTEVPKQSSAQEESIAPVPSVDESVPTTPPSIVVEEDDMPTWLRTTPSVTPTTPSTPQPISPTPSKSEKVSEVARPPRPQDNQRQKQKHRPSDGSSKDKKEVDKKIVPAFGEKNEEDLPAWMRGTDAAKVTAEVNEELTTPSRSITESLASGITNNASTVKKEDLPSWLTEDIVPVPTETKPEPPKEDIFHSRAELRATMDKDVPKHPKRDRTREGTKEKPEESTKKEESITPPADQSNKDNQNNQRDQRDRNNNQSNNQHRRPKQKPKDESPNQGSSDAT